jgi:hypothetical protein
MAYHMPVHVLRQWRTVIRLLQELGYLSGDLPKLLDAVFAKLGETATNDFLHSREGSGLGYDNKLYLVRVSADTGTTRLDSLANPVYPVTNFCHKETANDRTNKNSGSCRNRDR